MTRTEALEILETYHSGKSVEFSDYMEAFDIAVTALRSEVQAEMPCSNSCCIENAHGYCRWNANYSTCKAKGL